MSRRTHHARRGTAAPSKPAWIWLLAGLVLGILLSALAVYGGLAPDLRRGPTGPEPQAQAPRAGEEAEDAPAPSSRRQYDFYTVLPEMEVLMPDSELQAQVRAETQAPPAAPTDPATPPPLPTGQSYRLQAGSYRDPRPAEETKARLALLGIVANVQSVNINGSTWHRVYLGPFASATEVEQVKQRLAEEGIDALTVRAATP